MRNKDFFNDLNLELGTNIEWNLNLKWSGDFRF